MREKNLKYSIIRLVAALSLILVIGVIGCGIFETRDPEDPTGSQTTGDLSLTPEEVFTNLSASIAVRNPDLWISAFADSFNYIADPVAYENPALFDSWDWNDEDRFIRQLLSSDILTSGRLRSLVFEDVNNHQSADSAHYESTYRLNIPLITDNSDSLYTGTVELTMHRSDFGGWQITSWYDRAGGDAQSMSWLRIQF